MTKVLAHSFFNRSAERVARELVGAYLVRRVRGKTCRYRITETEAYVGPHDFACHASKGRTKRTEVMFGPPGRWYVYLCYGMHWMLNVVTGEDGYPAAVLIRGIENISGPGRVTKALAITGALHGAAANQASGLWFEKGESVPSRLVQQTPRIGVAYAGEWADKHYRFVLKDMPQFRLRTKRRTVS